MSIDDYYYYYIIRVDGVATRIRHRHLATERALNSKRQARTVCVTVWTNLS